MLTAEMPTHGRVWLEAKTQEEEDFITRMQSHMERGGSVRMQLLNPNNIPLRELTFATKKAVQQVESPGTQTRT